MPKVFAAHRVVSNCCWPPCLFACTADRETFSLTSDWRMRWVAFAVPCRHQHTVPLNIRFALFILKIPMKKPSQEDYKFFLFIYFNIAFSTHYYYYYFELKTRMWRKIQLTKFGERKQESYVVYGYETLSLELIEHKLSVRTGCWG